MNTDRAYAIDDIAMKARNEICELFEIDPDKDPCILRVNNGQDIRHVIFWSHEKQYYEKEITHTEYDALKDAGFPCGL